jgi:hypothetical protein
MSFRWVNERRASELMYHVLGMRTSAIRGEVSAACRTIWVARKSPELLPPSLPWLLEG